MSLNITLSQDNSSSPVAVVGDGIGARLLIQVLKSQYPEQFILWFPNTEAKLLPPVLKDAPFQEVSSKGRQTLLKLPDWPPEGYLMASGLDDGTNLLEKDRNCFEVKVQEGMLIQSIRWKESIELQLSSGELVPLSALFFADTLMSLAQLLGRKEYLNLKKALKIKSDDVVGALQLIFTHDAPSQEPFNFSSKLSRAGANEPDRRLWGYFENDKSIWTLLLSPEEAVSNHELAKLLRRMRSTILKIFPQDETTPAIPRFEREVFRFEAESFSLSSQPEAALLSYKQFFVLRDHFGARALCEAIGHEAKTHTEQAMLSDQTPN